MIVLLQPPFLRLIGSHNSRPPMELCYASSYLERAGIEHVVLNADATDASKYIKWSSLYRDFHYLKDAIDGRSPLFTETLERVLSYNPEAVVIGSGDSILPVVDTGSPWVGVHFSRLFRESGIKTIGIGPFYGQYNELFEKEFDAIISRPATEILAQYFKGRIGASKDGRAVFLGGFPPLDLPPSFRHLVPAGAKLDYILSSFGCRWRCSFCLANEVYGMVHQVPVEIFGADLASRKDKHLYMRDLVFPYSLKRLTELASLVGWDNGHTYTVDIRPELVVPKMLEPMARFGITHVKIGMEMLDDAALMEMGKEVKAGVTEKAVIHARDFGMKITLYVLLGYGDREAMVRTLEYVEDIQPDNLVVNIRAYADLADPASRYDCHFSWESARRLGIDDDILWRFLYLEDQLKNRTIEVIK